MGTEDKIIDKYNDLWYNLNRRNYLRGNII